MVADIGAGTGMLAELFLEAGYPVVAIEPNAEMLAACAELAAQYPRLRVVQASAEDTTLPSQSVDLIVVGRAMHWFDWPQAHREFQRILKPGGWVLVATNGHRSSGAAVSDELSAITRRWRMDSAEADTRQEFDTRLQSFFDSETLQRTKLHHAMTVTFPTLLGYVESLSAIPRPGKRGYQEMVAELRALFDCYQRGGIVKTPLSCQLYLGRLRVEYESTLAG